MAKARKPRSKTPKQGSCGGGNKGEGANPVVKKRAATPPRQFGSLRGVVTVDEKFFEPLSTEDIEAWER